MREVHRIVHVAMMQKRATATHRCHRRRRPLASASHFNRSRTSAASVLGVAQSEVIHSANF